MLKGKIENAWNFRSSSRSEKIYRFRFRFIPHLSFLILHSSSLIPIPILHYSSFIPHPSFHILTPQTSFLLLQFSSFIPQVSSPIPRIFIHHSLSQIPIYTFYPLKSSILIPHFSFLISLTLFLFLHSSFLFLHSSFFFFITYSCFLFLISLLLIHNLCYF